MARFCQLSKRRLFMKTENCNACINAFLCLNFILSELTNAKLWEDVQNGAQS